MIMCVLLCYPVSIRIYYQQGGRFLVEGYIHGNIKHEAKTDDIDKKEICIWGNKQILNKNNEILYFLKCIGSGIITVSNLKIIEGKICNSYLFNKLSNKTNYLSELYQISYGIRKLLTENFSSYPTSQIQSVKKLNFISTKDHYHKIIQKQLVPPKSCDCYNKFLNIQKYNYSPVYILKVKSIPEKTNM